jgi:hypothetical protein
VGSWLCRPHGRETPPCAAGGNGDTTSEAGAKWGDTLLQMSPFKAQTHTYSQSQPRRDRQFLFPFLHSGVFRPVSPGTRKTTPHTSLVSTFGNQYRKTIGFLLSYLHSVVTCTSEFVGLILIYTCWPKAEIHKMLASDWSRCPRCQEALCFVHVFPESLSNYCTPVLREKIMYSPSRKLWLSLCL